MPISRNDPIVEDPLLDTAPAPRKSQTEDAIPQNDQTSDPLSMDSMTKLLESARAEVRGYRSLYFTLLGFALLSPTAIATIYRVSKCTGSISPLYVSFVFWLAGIALMLFGSFSILPSVRYTGNNSFEFISTARVSDAIRELDPAMVRKCLRDAIEGTHEIQRSTAARGRWVALGSLLIILSVGLSFIRWIVNCQEVQP